MPKDNLYKILKGGVKGKRVLELERQLYEGMEKEAEVEEQLIPRAPSEGGKQKVIPLTPLSPRSHPPHPLQRGKTETLRLAAQAEPETEGQQGEFYISPDDKFALRISFRNKEAYASLITDSGTETSDAVLYCSNLTKYFMQSGTQNEFYIGTFDPPQAGNLKDFAFELLFPSDYGALKIDEDKVFGFVSQHSKVRVSNLIFSGDEIGVVFESDFKLRCVMVRSEGYYSEVLKVQEERIMIPKNLAGEIVKMSFY